MESVAEALARLRELATGAEISLLAERFEAAGHEFALVGGNDGWLGSENMLDQIPLWRNGQYIKMPLRPETVAREFSVVTQLSPN